MEFSQIKRGNLDREELVRDAEGNPIYFSPSSFDSFHHQRPRLGPSFDVWGEEDSSTSYHGAAAATKIQELNLIDHLTPPLPPTYCTTDQSLQLIGSSNRIGGGGDIVEREQMFHKVVTPSDVGKLNRLVIPKQHAEKYFPLDYDQLKGLLLNFEDRNGKEWRFRYSYWNSSQSYVITKGWSRFVKDKKLDAGDIVSFHRGIGESSKDRLFIDWRHQTPPAACHPGMNAPSMLQWGRIIYPLPASMSIPMLRPDYPYHHQNQRDSRSSSSGGGGINIGYGVMNLGQIGGVQEMGDLMRTRVINSVPVIHNNAAVATKRLRLFGVNMDCSSTPQEYSESLVLPSVPLLVTTVLAPPLPSSSSSSSSFGHPLRQSSQYDGSPMQSLHHELRGKGYRGYDVDT